MHAFQQLCKSHSTGLFRKILELPAVLNESQSRNGTEESLRKPSSLFETRQNLNQPELSSTPSKETSLLFPWSFFCFYKTRASLTPDTWLNSPPETCRGR